MGIFIPMMGRSIKNIVKSVLRESRENSVFITENDDLNILYKLKSDIEGDISRVYNKLTNKSLSLPNIEIKIDDDIKDGKIAGFKRPDQENSNGVIGVKSKALKNMDYLRSTITHELIHAVVGDEHSDIFDKMADELGLSKKYRD